MHHVFGFVEFYLIPFLFAVGLFYFLNGFINYFLIGPGYEEDRREMGRQSLLWATLLFAIGLILFGLSGWFQSIGAQFDEDIDVELGSSPDVVPIPNVPFEE